MEVPYDKSDTKPSIERRIRSSIRTVLYLIDVFDRYGIESPPNELSDEDHEFRFSLCKSGYLRLEPLEWLYVHAKLRPIPSYSASPILNHPYITIRLEQIEHMKYNDFQSYFLLVEATIVYIETDWFSLQ